MMENKPRFWKSLNQLANKPESIERSHHEFVSGTTDNFDVNQLPEVSRRKFLAVLGASAAFAATACNNYRDKGEIISYNKKPESIYYGIANYYASTLNDGQGILVKAREGRPIKIDGNPEHKINKGKVDTIAQASILDLYDPARCRNPKYIPDEGLLLDRSGLKDVEWLKVDEKIQKALKDSANSGKEIAIVAHNCISPTQKKLFADFTVKYPTTKVYHYELFDNKNKKEAWKACYGNADLPALKICKANVLVSLQFDFLGNEGNIAEQIMKFTHRRDVDNLAEFSRFYCVEGDYSITGATSDKRLRLNPAKQYEFVLSLMNEIYKKNASAITLDPSVVSMISSYNLDSFASQNHLNKHKLETLVPDLIANKGKSLVIAGNILSKDVHIAVNLLNEMLGNTEMYDFTQTSITFCEERTVAEFDDLIGSMTSGKVGVLIHFDSNPAYHLPADYGYATALKKVPTVVSMVESVNESAALSNYILPINHALESWGDFALRTGNYSLQQPIINPIHNTRQKEAILLNWMNDDVKTYSHDIYHKFLMNNWETAMYPMLGLSVSFKEFWYSFVHDGFVNALASIATATPINSVALAGTKATSANGFTVMLINSMYVGDGRYANNGWLQEVPHPITKIMWDNYAMISPATAKELKVTYGEDAMNQIADGIEIDINGRKLKLPIVVQPGMADKVIAIQLGYGRTEIGEVGQEVGFNANILMSKSAGLNTKVYTGVNVSKTGETYTVVSSQEHHALDDAFVKDMHLSRHIINEYTVPFYSEFNEKFEKAKKEIEEKFKDDPIQKEKALKSEAIHLLGHHEYALHNIYTDVEYPDVKWAMAIDMNKCVGCGACVTACNVENNVPIVGKNECGHGREMHWMRIDTYFSGTPDEPITSIQPMICQHCDHAPCENVCPVAATTHSPDGLNQMTYNRCVGTRYCANNCPYKVRRFNFYDFRDEFQDAYYYKDTLELLHNPEVTVRSRGVMEKCTFCSQRIMEAKQEATKEGRKLVGTDVKTACQVACPASAIIFGDMNDKESLLYKLRSHNLGYKVLESINVKPNVTYISKLRNTNEEGGHSGH